MALATGVPASMSAVGLRLLRFGQGHVWLKPHVLLLLLSHMQVWSQAAAAAEMPTEQLTCEEVPALEFAKPGGDRRSPTSFIQGAFKRGQVAFEEEDTLSSPQAQPLVHTDVHGKQALHAMRIPVQAQPQVQSHAPQKQAPPRGQSHAPQKQVHKQPRRNEARAHLDSAKVVDAASVSTQERHTSALGNNASEKQQQEHRRQHQQKLKPHSQQQPQGRSRQQEAQPQHLQTRNAKVPAASPMAANAATVAATEVGASIGTDKPEESKSGMPSAGLSLTLLLLVPLVIILSVCVAWGAGRLGFTVPSAFASLERSDTVEGFVLGRQSPRSRGRTLSGFSGYFTRAPSTRKPSLATPALSKAAARRIWSPQGGACLGRASVDHMQSGLTTPLIPEQDPPHQAVTRLPPPDNSKESSLPGTQASLPDEFARHLCPSMRVPEGCECTLLVPRLSFESRLSPEQLSIDDPEGSSVMRASFSTAQGSGPSTLPLPSGAWRLNLYGAGGEPMGFCQEEQAVFGQRVAESTLSGGRHVADSPDQRSLTVHEANSGRLFALLRSSASITDGYEVWGYGGWRLFLCPTESRDGGGWAFTNERSQLLAAADSKRESSHRTVRIDAGVDASVVALTLMGVDVLHTTEDCDSGKCQPRLWPLSR
eukprot:CAMPEP_0172935384 /NCGR_PEP_ID=MMETSP1075-20121228/221488_1 /TAXON_ID=2916 /ORGANISM="Ceratium fusus, Strain PA161109" /LENGTH=650 /DNA_ID=CAMNT_0013796743 /DNA_START=14 /DNA_END=1966 /DNA_ORIENTATION=-